jgi:hypothetical protein
MNKQKIKPEKITSPFQLLAAWLVGLIIINGSFLGTAISLNQSEWTRSVLIIASIINVPIFLVAFFLLQTRFRPELQEDSYYHQYLNAKTNQIISIKKESTHNEKMQQLIAEKKMLSEKNLYLEKQITTREKTWGVWKIGLNDYLPDFSDIREELRKNNITISDFFGSTNPEKTNPPKKYIINISSDVDFESKLWLLQILAKFNLDGYQYFYANEYDEQSIYIGSYGFDDGEEYFPFSQEFRDLIDKDMEEVDLKYIEKKISQNN